MSYDPLLVHGLFIKRIVLLFVSRIADLFDYFNYFCSCTGFVKKEQVEWWKDKNEDELCSWLYKTYVNELFSYGVAFGADRVVLQDVIHDIFLYFVENKSGLKDIEHVKFYLFRALKNRLISAGQTIQHDALNEEIEYAFSLKVTDTDLLIVEEERARLIKRVNELLLCLTNRQREAIYLRYIQELSYEEIGELLHMTPKASRKLVSRALIRIRENNISIFLFLAVFKTFFR